jgi:hypothetical protein
MDENKKINITGQNNRYQIKKLTQEKTTSKRKNIVEIEKISCFYSHDLQKQLLLDPTLHETEYSFITSELKRKVSSYKQQDLTKSRYNSDAFITIDYVIQLLKESELKCCFCSQEVLLLYGFKRDIKQWTLDRINNDEGHNINNVLIACLECNLKRRTTSKDAFMFTKNLTIVKDEYY